MQKWEYCFVYPNKTSFVAIFPDGNSIEMDKHHFGDSNSSNHYQASALMLNRMARGGWELVQRDGMDYIFKRPIE
jgi:hypothetical protein